MSESNSQPTSFIPPRRGTQRHLVVHFMCHARPAHKPTPDSETDTSMRDPGLAEEGIDRCREFSSAIQESGEYKYITHILCSPMTRTVQTAMIALVPCLLSGVKIFALPELQNLDSSPNGRGTDLDELSNLFSIAASRNRDLVDVTTFGRKGWEYKDEGSVWHADEIQWRVDHMKGFLKGILLGGGMKRVEVAVVSHGSFLRKLVKEVTFKDVAFTTCVFDEQGGFREIGEEELRAIREQDMERES